MSKNGFWRRLVDDDSEKIVKKAVPYVPAFITGKVEIEWPSKAKQVV